MAPALPAKPLFKIAEVAALTGVPQRSIYTAITTGDIPADQVVRLGGLRIKRSYLLDVLGSGDDATSRETVTR